MRHVLSACMVVCATGTLGAQAGTFATFGKGCPGTGGSGNVCASSNGNGGTLRQTHNTNTFALPVDATAPMIVLGFELFTRAVSSPVTIQTQVYAGSSSGAPTGQPLRAGTMQIGAAAGFYRTTFPPLVIRPNTRFFISYASTTAMWFPFLASGTKSVHYWHPPASTTWRGPFTSVPWSWRVLCAGGGGAVPTLGNTGVPTINNSFSIDLDKATASTAAVLVVGASNTQWGAFQLPLDLTGAGAAGCSLLVSFDVIAGVPVDANGKGSQKITIPNVQALVGLLWHNQFVVIDGRANTLGAAFTNGGTATVGR